MERSPLPPLHPIHEVDSIFVVVSRLSTAGQDALTLASHLPAGPDRKVTSIEVTGTDEIKNREHLWQQMERACDEGYVKPLIIGAGGDGTIHHIGKNMLHPDAPKHVAGALMTPWGLGHENDIFACLHPAAMKGSVGILHNPAGREIIDHPLEVTATVDGQVVEDIALAYLTLGPSADGAEALATRKHRQFRSRFPHWMRALVDMGKGAPIVLGRPAPATVKSAPESPARAITEISFNNAEHMGGMGNYSRSTRLGDRAMHYAELDSNHPLAVISYVARIALGVPAGQRTTGAVSLTFENSSLHGQIEGEPIRGTAGQLGAITAISVRPGDKAVRYYVTKSARHKGSRHTK